MSIPRMCGAVPSSLTVPAILPSAAALTLWLIINDPRPTNTRVAKIAAHPRLR